MLVLYIYFMLNERGLLLMKMFICFFEMRGSLSCRSWFFYYFSIYSNTDFLIYYILVNLCSASRSYPPKLSWFFRLVLGRYMEFEARYGDLASIFKIDKRMSGSNSSQVWTSFLRNVKRLFLKENMHVC